MTKMNAPTCAWTGAPWERDDPRQTGDEVCGNPRKAGGAYCFTHAALYARWLRNQGKGPEHMEKRECAWVQCGETFLWSSWGQDRRYHDRGCKKEAEKQALKEARLAKAKERLAVRESMSEKRCVGGRTRQGCGELKPIECFREMPASRRSNLCETCTRTYMSGYDSQRAPARSARHRQRGRENMAATHGITVEQFDDLVRRSEGRCGICDQALAELDTDHDRDTGLVRGLLCEKHNMGIGLLGHDITLLARAIGYLQATPTFVVPVYPRGTKLCQRCGDQPKLVGRGQRFCVACAATCEVCGASSSAGRGICARCHADREAGRRARRGPGGGRPAGEEGDLPAPLPRTGHAGTMGGWTDRS